MISNLIFTLAQERDRLVSLDKDVSGVVLYYGDSFIPYIMTVVQSQVIGIEDWDNFYFLGVNWVYDPNANLEDVKFKLIYGDSTNA